MTPQQLRRRRLLGAAVTVLVLALVVAGVAVLSSSGGGAVRYVPHGSSSSLLTTPTPSVPAGRQGPFRAVPAAVSAAARMPLASQVAQLFMVTVPGHSLSGAAIAAPWGGVVLGPGNFATSPQLVRLVKSLDSQLQRTAGPAPLIAALQAGGPHTAFPRLPPRGQADVGSTGDPTVEQNEALSAGRSLAGLGVAMTLAPIADVDVPSGALEGSLFGSDPGVVRDFTLAALRGYAASGTIAAVGHFPGQGAASADPDQSPATVGGTLSTLTARDLVPFSAVAGRAAVMLMSNAAYAAFDGVTPAGLSAQAITLLRDTLHFQGVVMSDDLDATLQPTGETSAQVALQALQAGCDLLYLTGALTEQQAALDGVLSAARRSATIRQRVHDALLRVLTLKAAHGLL